MSVWISWLISSSKKPLFSARQRKSGNDYPEIISSFYTVKTVQRGKIVCEIEKRYPDFELNSQLTWTLSSFPSTRPLPFSFHPRAIRGRRTMRYFDLRSKIKHHSEIKDHQKNQTEVLTILRIDVNLRILYHPSIPVVRRSTFHWNELIFDLWNLIFEAYHVEQTIIKIDFTK